MEQHPRARAQTRVEAGENAVRKPEPRILKEWGEWEQAGVVAGAKAVVPVEAPEEVADRAVEIDSRLSGSF